MTHRSAEVEAKEFTLTKRDIYRYNMNAREARGRIMYMWETSI